MGCGAHWCIDETIMTLSLLGAARFLPSWIAARWRGRHAKPNCRHDHDHDHG